MAAVASASRMPMYARSTSSLRPCAIRIAPCTSTSNLGFTVWQQSFSTTTPSFKSKYQPKVLSYFNKRAIKLRIKAGLASYEGVKGKISDTIQLPLEEAFKVCRSWYPTGAYGHDYRIKVVAQPVGSVQMNALKNRVYLPHNAVRPKRRVTSEGKQIDHPEETKKEIVAVLAESKALVAAAEAAGADHVGGQDLVQAIIDGKVTPARLFVMSECMVYLRRGEVARQFGPRGLMPSEKRGTLATTAEELTDLMVKSRGGTDWTVDGDGIFQTIIGTNDFTFEQLKSNVETLVGSIRRTASGASEDKNDGPGVSTRAIKLVELRYATSRFILSDVTSGKAATGNSDVNRIIPTPQRLPPI